MTEYIILDEFLSEKVKESADAQGYLHELVRCKNCKNRNNPIDYQVESEGMHTSDDWLCADGEPKGDEQE